MQAGLVSALGLQFAPDSERVKAAISRQAPKQAAKQQAPKVGPKQTRKKPVTAPTPVAEPAAAPVAAPVAEPVPAPVAEPVPAPAAEAVPAMSANEIVAGFAHQAKMFALLHADIIRRLEDHTQTHKSGGMPHDAVLMLRIAGLEATVRDLKAQKRKRDEEINDYASSEEEEAPVAHPAKAVYYYPPAVVAPPAICDQAAVAPPTICEQAAAPQQAAAPAPIVICERYTPVHEEMVSDDIVVGPVFEEEEEEGVLAPVQITLKIHSLSADFQLERSTPRTQADYYVVPEDAHGINLLCVFQNLETCKRVLDGRALIISEAAAHRCVRQAEKRLGAIDDMLRQVALRHDADVLHKLPLGKLSDDTKIRNVFSEFRLSKHKTAKNIVIVDSATQNTRLALLKLFQS